MLTFVVHTRRTPDALARVVSLFHRRRVQIHSLTARRFGESDVLCIEVQLEVDEHKARRIEANLYNLVDVLLVERPASVGDKCHK
jgi:acetolactate synthase small subunit